jgi:hypothetical protein
MSKPKPPINPFYLLAMLFGVVFTLTACAYGVMMVHANRVEGLPDRGQPGFDLMDLLNKRGAAILCVEIAGLAVFGIAAIYLDHVRGQRQIAKQASAESRAAKDLAEKPSP